VSLPRAKYVTGAQVSEFCRDVLERVEHLPGVESASAINFLPLSRLNGGVVPFSVPGRASTDTDERLFARYAVVDSRYFRTMNIPLLAGRGFQDEDAGQSHGVAIVDEAMADRLWPHGDALGHQLQPKLSNQRDFWVAESNNRPLTIVGIVGHVKEDGATLPGREAPVLYVPYRQNPSWMMHLVIRTAGNPNRWAKSARAQILSVDADQGISSIQPMEGVIAETFGTPKTVSQLSAGFALIATVLAGIGVFSLVCYVVGQRTREIGIRIALGAARGEVFRGILAEGAFMGGIGAGLGLMATLLVNRIIANQIFGIASTSSAALVLAAALLIAVSVSACYLPARRAMNIAPVEALRGD
jgi:putative ABC transport system permease protein